MPWERKAPTDGPLAAVLIGDYPVKSGHELFNPAPPEIPPGYVPDCLFGWASRPNHCDVRGMDRNKKTPPEVAGCVIGGGQETRTDALEKS